MLSSIEALRALVVARSARPDRKKLVHGMLKDHIFRGGQLSCKDALECFFNLNRLEVDVYNTLARKGPATNKQLAEMMDRDRSTIYRALHNLVSVGLCLSRPETRERGGYYTVFIPVSPLMVKEEVRSRLASWVEQITESLKGFDAVYEEYKEHAENAEDDDDDD